MRVFTLIGIMLLTACGRWMPAGFWDEFHPELIQKNKNDQGPWGGHRATWWKATDPYTFTPDKVIRFATLHGWAFVDTMAYEAIIGGRHHFPLGHSGIDTSQVNNFTHHPFPIWTTLPSTLYRFKTDWITVVPGTDEAYDAYGYVVIDRSGKEMTVYHLWGE